MANHCYLTCRALSSDSETILSELREFLSWKFPEFDLHRDDNYFGIRHHPDEIRDVVSIWLQPLDFPILFRRIKNHSYWMTPDWAMLNFRHGHSNPMYWWFEYEIEAYFTKKYGCRAIDDGIGEYNQGTISYPDYNTFLNSRASSGLRMLDLSYLMEILKFDKNSESLKSLVGLQQLPVMKYNDSNPFTLSFEWEDLDSI